jgi:hypothetical protein
MLLCFYDWTNSIIMINKLKVDGRLVFNSCLYGNASCHEVELPENDHETGESIQVRRMDRSSEK